MIIVALIIAILANPLTFYLALRYCERKEKFYIQAILAKNAGELKSLQTDPRQPIGTSVPPLPDLSSESSLDDEEWFKLINQDKSGIK